MTKAKLEFENNRLITVFRTGDQVKIAIAQSMLNSASIFNCTKNETVQHLFGLGAIGGYNPFTGPLELQVESNHLEEAKDLLSDLIEDCSERFEK